MREPQLAALATATRRMARAAWVAPSAQPASTSVGQCTPR